MVIGIWCHGRSRPEGCSSTTASLSDKYLVRSTRQPPSSCPISLEGCSWIQARLYHVYRCPHQSLGIPIGECSERDLDHDHGVVLKHFLFCRQGRQSDSIQCGLFLCLNMLALSVSNMPSTSTSLNEEQVATSRLGIAEDLRNGILSSGRGIGLPHSYSYNRRSPDRPR